MAYAISLIIGLFTAGNPSQLILMLRLCVAVVAGILVGDDRQRLGSMAGRRTYALLSLGSALFTVIGAYGIVGGDTTRVAAQIVSGVVGLSTLVVIAHEGRKHGLTSAAAMWCVAALGMAAGSGQYILTAFGCALILVVRSPMRWLKGGKRANAPRVTAQSQPDVSISDVLAARDGADTKVVEQREEPGTGESGA
jgi:uncharacterized membrane protein YhiD involved in acid resistance